MTSDDIYPSILVGSKIDKIVTYVQNAYPWSRYPVGFRIENASTDPKAQRILRDGEAFDPEPEYFWSHELFIMPKVLLSADGVGTSGPDRIGSGLDFTGAAGDAMVWCNNAQFKYWYEDDSDTQFYLYAPFDSNYRGFDYHPHCYSGGGTLHDHFFLGAYEAYGYLDSNDSKYKLGSATGKQPITGGVSYPNCPNSGRFTIDDALLFAGNKGAGWTIEDIYCRSLLQGLFYTQYGTRNSQTAIGKGVVELPSGDGFAGVLTGADDINDNVDAFGTGTGSGINGQTPIRWNNLENWTGGNVWEFTAGINLYNSDGTDGNGNPYTAGSYRVTKPDGTGIIAGTLPVGSYITGEGTVPLVDGYYSTVQTDPLGASLFIQQNVGDVNSGDDKGFCDYVWYPRYNPSTMFSGGNWPNGLAAGVSCRYSSAPSASARNLGARLKYIPQ